MVKGIARRHQTSPRVGRGRPQCDASEATASVTATATATAREAIESAATAIAIATTGAIIDATTIGARTVTETSAATSGRVTTSDPNKSTKETVRRRRAVRRAVEPIDPVARRGRLGK